MHIENVGEYLKGNVLDYQMSAFLMAVYFNDMTKNELLEFTTLMRDSGEIIKFEKITCKCKICDIINVTKIINQNKNKNLRAKEDRE